MLRGPSTSIINNKAITPSIFLKTGSTKYFGFGAVYFFSGSQLSTQLCSKETGGCCSILSLSSHEHSILSIRDNRALNGGRLVAFSTLPLPGCSRNDALQYLSAMESLVPYSTNSSATYGKAISTFVESLNIIGETYLKVVPGVPFIVEVDIRDYFGELVTDKYNAYTVDVTSKSNDLVVDTGGVATFSAGRSKLSLSIHLRSKDNYEVYDLYISLNNVRSNNEVGYNELTMFIIL
jgi:hypothetical protein